MIAQLSPEDQAAMRRVVGDLSDIAPRDLERYRDGFKRAYAAAEAVRRGLAPLMSGRVR